MKPEKVIKDNFLRNFLLTLLLIIFTGTAVSTAVLYFGVHKTLTTHYSAALTIITEIRESLVMKTFWTGLFFLVLTGAGVGVLTLLYTHRIAGPLYRIRMSARAIAEGRLDTVIKLRNRDAVGKFADTINTMTENCRGKVTELSSELHHLKLSLAELKSADENKNTEDLLKRVHEADRKIRKLLGSLNT